MAKFLDRLFRPGSVAIIGASTDPKKVGGRPLHFLKKHGFTGDVWPVNPRANKIEGYRCFPDIESLPGAPDASIILVSPRNSIAAVKSLADKGCRAAIVLAGGFAETGDVGSSRQDALMGAAQDMRLLGPNTIGLLNVTDGVTLSASGALDAEGLRSGGVAVVSQSGGILGSLLSRAVARGVGLSHLAATGNEADIDVSDVMTFLADDPETKVVALYLETIRRPSDFRDAATLLANAGKRLVVYKVGQSDPGAHAAASHTGALAGEDQVFDGFFQQTGAIRVNRYDDLIDLPAGLSLSSPVRGNRLAILTHTGGAAGLVADVCGMSGFETPPPSPKTARKLGELLKDEGFNCDRNPVDLTLAGLDPEIVYQAIMTLSTSNEYDAILPVVGSSSVGRPYMVADPVIRAVATEVIPIVVYSSPHAPAIVARLNEANVPAFETPEACANLLKVLLPSKKIFERRSPVLISAEKACDLTGTLNEFEAKRVFAEFGINSVREVVVDNSAAAVEAATKIGERVAIKILSRLLPHKTDVGGVRLNVAPQDAASVCDDIAASVAAHGVYSKEGFLIQEQLSGGIEMILGYRNDPALGPAVMIGAGGILADLFEDVALCVLPASPKDICKMIASLKIMPLLNGYRGAKPVDLENLVETIARFMHMCESINERLIEAEINPLFLGPTGMPPLALDGVLSLKK